MLCFLYIYICFEAVCTKLSSSKNLLPRVGGACSESLLLLQVDQSLREKSWQDGGKMGGNGGRGKLLCTEQLCV